MMLTKEERGTGMPAEGGAERLPAQTRTMAAGGGRPPASPVGAGRQLLFLREEELRLAQDLLFFGYREFTAGADEILAELDMGRAHHRVLHFVGRRPGITVGELLAILAITKQSLGRVLKQLVDQGYILQKEGESDRRQRLLYATAKGESLCMQLAGLQTERIARALADIGPGAHDDARRFLIAMLDGAGRNEALQMIARAENPARGER